MPYLIEVETPPADGSPCVRGTVAGVKALTAEAHIVAHVIRRKVPWSSFWNALERDLRTALAPFQEPKE